MNKEKKDEGELITSQATCDMAGKKIIKGEDNHVRHKRSCVQKRDWKTNKTETTLKTKTGQQEQEDKGRNKTQIKRRGRKAKKHNTHK